MACQEASPVSPQSFTTDHAIQPNTPMVFFVLSVFQTEYCPSTIIEIATQGRIQSQYFSADLKKQKSIFSL